jgi:hypothetical protein
MTDELEAAINTIRQAADDRPNNIDYPVSNLLTLIDNLMAGQVSEDLAAEIKETSGLWLKKLFEGASA